MLNELDKEMESQGLRHVRYADDFSIYTKSNQAARKVGNEIYLFLKNKLKLSINREKSGIRKPVNFTILGYGFVPTYVKGEKGKYQLVVSEKSWKTLKLKLKTITRKTIPSSFDERIQKLKEVNEDGFNTSAWQVYMTNSSNSMAGYVTDCHTACSITIIKISGLC